MTDNRIYYSQRPVIPVDKPSVPISKPAGTKNSDTAFGQVLEQELNGIKFSQHALQRMQNRNIRLEPADLAKLNDAVAKAAQKGARESLVLMDNLALVVSIKNRTVITAMDGASMKDNVFTNIDSAVIV